MGKKLPLNRTARNARVNTNCNPGRRPERREHLLDTGPVLSPIAKICNLEKRLTARRKSKIEKGMEGLRQPLATKTRKGLGTRELFNPSVVSVKAGGLDSDFPSKDSRDSRKTLYKKYLQLLPMDSMLKIRRCNNTMNIPPTKKCLKPLPAIEVQSAMFVPKLSCNQKQLDKTPFKSYRPWNDRKFWLIIRKIFWLTRKSDPEEIFQYEQTGKKSGEFLTKTKTPNYENLIYQLYKELLDIVVDGFPKCHPAVKHLALITEKQPYHVTRWNRSACLPSDRMQENENTK